MPKSSLRGRNYSSVIRPNYYRQTSKSTLTSKQLPKEKDQDPPPQNFRFSSYEVVTLLAMFAGINRSNDFLICLSCFMAIAAMDTPITKRILLLIKGGFFPNKINSP